MSIDDQIILSLVDPENGHFAADFDETSLPESEVDATSLLQKMYQLLCEFWQVFKEISRISFPRAFSYTYSFTVLFVIIMLTQTSESLDELAAITLIAAFLNTVLPIALSMLFALGVIVSKLYGQLMRAGDDEQARERIKKKISQAYFSGLMTATVLAAVTILPFLFSRDIFIHVFRQNPSIAQIAHDFLQWMTLLVPTELFRLTTEMILFSFNHEKAVMLLAQSSFLTGVLLSVWLTFGGLGIPAQGAYGVAAGCISTSFLTAASFGLYTGLHPDFRSYHFFSFANKLKKIAKPLRELIKLGFSIVISSAVELSLPLIMGALAGVLGSLQQASWNYVMQLMFFILLFSAAFGQQCAKMMGQAIGMAKYSKASKIGIFGLITTLLYLTPVAILPSIYPNALTVFLSDDKEGIRTVLPTLMPIIASVSTLNIAQIGFLFQSRPLGVSYLATIASSLCLIAGVVASAWFAMGTQMDVYGLGAGELLGMALAILSLFIIWLKNISPQEIQQKHESTFVSEGNRRLLFWGNTTSNPSTVSIENGLTNPLTSVLDAPSALRAHA